VQLSDFDYELPERLIADEPSARRDGSRLLVVDRAAQTISHHAFHELENFVKSGDTLVRNNSKVIPARLFGEGPDGRRFEVLLLKNLHDYRQWVCLCRPGRRVRGDTPLKFPGGGSGIIRRVLDEEFFIELTPPAGVTALDYIFQIGRPPLPPYIKRDAKIDDIDRYQTVYAKDPGSVAAPTAGLHFTPELLEGIQRRGVSICDVTLHVGYGTFSPIRVDDLNDHHMHEETFHISDDTLTELARTRARQGRVIAVGTTSLRALESIPSRGNQGETDIFITPGFSFALTDALVTNFHLPKSTLFILISAFMGLDLARKSYAEAIVHEYRFFSYGDAMLIL
jgi:S-adenosylmethionine:tRNA ribosyltransferase-isomerase